MKLEKWGIKMKKINGYWVDENENKQNCCLYDEETAVRYSKILINRTDCEDCRYFIRCTNCTDCGFLNCAEDYKNQPMKYQTKRIGSRNDVTNTYGIFKKLSWCSGW